MKVTQNVHKNDRTSYELTSAVRPETRVDNAVKEVVCNTAKTETKIQIKTVPLLSMAVFGIAAQPYTADWGQTTIPDTTN